MSRLAANWSDGRSLNSTHLHEPGLSERGDRLRLQSAQVVRQREASEEQMRSLGIWQVENATLTRVAEAVIELEQHLEDWIVSDPSLIQEGLVIVGRQVYLESGRLDLLALDPQGRWVVVEIKRGYVDRDTVAQVIDYAACLRELSAADFRSKLEQYPATTPLDLDKLLEDRGAADALEPEQRQLLLFVVGTGKADSLERVARFLSEPYGLPISVVLFHVFRLDDHRMCLAREVTEQEIPAIATGHGSTLSVDAVLKLAKEFGTQAQLQRAIDLAGRKGLRVRPFKTCLMFAPPSNATRCLFTIWAEPEKDGLSAYVAIEGFTMFFPLERADVEERVGPDGWRTLDMTQFDDLLSGIEGLDLGS